MDFVAYYRVSTQKQGESGYGLKSQQESIFKFIDPHDHVLHEYTEIETGTGKRERPELEKALKMCRQTGATLVCARMDRLFRNVYLMAKLMESKTEFVFCDFPEASRMTIQILAVLAEYEAMRISKNTKAAMEVVKKYGSKSGRPIGNPKGWNATDRRMGPASNYKTYLEHPANKTAFAFVRQLTLDTNVSSKKLAHALNVNGYQTHLGKDWAPGMVCKLRRVFTSVGIRDLVSEYEVYKVNKELTAVARVAGL